MSGHIARELTLLGGKMDDAVKAELKKPLQRARVKSRGQSGRAVSYLEGYDVIDRANELFDFDGWSMEVKNVELVRADKNSLYRAVVGVHVGAAYREDVGLGISAGDSQEAQETAIKGAVTDAMKRAFRTFGPQFGNSLYDKDGPELAEEERDCPIHKTPMTFIPAKNTWAHKVPADDGQVTVCTGKAA